MYKLRFTIYDFFRRKTSFRMLSYFVIFVSLSYFASSCMQVSDASYKPDTLLEKKKETWKSEDEFYSIYYLKNRKLALTDIRPSKKDTSIRLCIPAAFTQLDDGSIDGLFIVDGKVKKRKV